MLDGLSRKKKAPALGKKEAIQVFLDGMGDPNQRRKSLMLIHRDLALVTITASRTAGGKLVDELDRAVAEKSASAQIPILTPVHLRSLLEGRAFGASEAQCITAWVAGYAVLSEHSAESFHNVLLRHSGVFREWLGTVAPAEAPPEVVLLPPTGTGHSGQNGDGDQFRTGGGEVTEGRPSGQGVVVVQEDVVDLVLDGLLARSTALSRSLRDAADRLESERIPPDTRLCEGIASFASDLARVHQDLLTLGYSGHESSTLVEAKDFLAARKAQIALKEKQHAVLRRASEVLVQARRLRAKEGTTEKLAAAVQEFQEVVMQTESSVLAVSGTLPPEVVELAEEVHPIPRLVKFVLGAGSNEDSLTWDGEFEYLKGRFSRDLVVGAARGMLELGPQEAGVANEEKPGARVVGGVDSERAAVQAVAPTAQARGPEPATHFAEKEPVKGETLAVVAVASSAPAPVQPTPLASSQVDPACVESAVTCGTQVAAAAQYPEQEATIEGDALFAWDLVGGGFPDLAYCVARTLEETEPGGWSWPSVPSWVCKAMHLAQFVESRNSLIGASVMEALSAFDGDKLLARGSQRQKDGMRLAVVAAAIQPALVQGGVPAALLGNLFFKGHLGRTFDLCRRLAAAEKGRPLDPVHIKAANVAASDRQALRRAAQDALDRAGSARTTFQIATNILHAWSGPSGVITQLLLPVVEADESRQPIVRQLVERFERDSDALDVEIRRTLEVIKKNRRPQPIVGGARNFLQSHMDEAVRLGRRWLDFIQAGSRDRADAGKWEASARMLRSDLPAVDAEIRAFLAEDQEPIARGGALACLRAIEALSRLLDPNMPLPSGDENVHRALCGRLLLGEGARLEDAWEPNWTARKEIVETVRNARKAGAEAWRRSLEHWSRTGDHEMSGRLLEYARWEPGLEKDLPILTESRDRSIDEWHNEVSNFAVRQREAIEARASSGWLDENDRGSLLAAVEGVEANLADRSVHFGRLRETLRTVEELLSGAVVKRKERFWKTLDPDSNLRQAFPAECEQINQSLGAGNLFVAQDLGAFLGKQGRLPEQQEEDDHLRTFLEEWLTPLAKIGVAEIAQAVRNQGTVGGRSYKALGRRSRELTADLLDMFAGKVRLPSEGAREEDARAVADWLGLEVQTIRQSERDGVGFKVKCAVMQDRRDCRLPEFGSAANGRYRIVVRLTQSDPDSVIRALETIQDEAVIWVRPQIVSVEERMALGRACRRAHRTVVLLDVALVAYLALHDKPNRFRVFVECAAAFTWAAPYKSISGEVAPELFFGRQAEREQVESPSGSCFIYGGRQLGKTALLRDVERRIHNPAEGRYAHWEDLKLVGKEHGIEELWARLGEWLRKVGVLPTLRPNSGTGVILEKLEEWLTAHREARMLWLLDEADGFLEEDRRSDFRQCTLLKGLMERSGRRFKVVFAGLHNVIRATKAGNHPLAHFGQPVQIGPAISGNAARETADLVSMPLRSLGYRFEDPSLPIRILSFTNYYPSLIQLYCRALLDEVSNALVGRGQGMEVPPFTISAEVLARVEKSPRLMGDIRDRIRWSLELDPRYEVIALVMACACYAEGERRDAEGFTAEWILEQVRTWWEDGFRGARGEAQSIIALMEEMVGLGILKQGTTGRFSFRSGSVIRLLGNPDEVNQRLLSREEQLGPEPEVFDESWYRGALLGDAGDGRRESAPSGGKQLPLPLGPRQQVATWKQEVKAGSRGLLRRATTLLQERLLLRTESATVSVVFGSSAGGMEHVAGGLSALTGQVCGSFTLTEEFDEVLESVVPKRPEGGTLLVLARPESLWSIDWVRKASEKVRQLYSKARPLSFVFLCDPEHEREHLRRHRPLGASLPPGVQTFHLGPWEPSFLRFLAKEQEPEGRCSLLARARNGIDDIAEATGLWPAMIEIVAEADSDESLREALEGLKAMSESVRWKARKMFNHSEEAEPDMGALAQIVGIGGSISPGVAAEAEILGWDEERRGRVKEALDAGCLFGHARRQGDGGYLLDRVFWRMLNATAAS